jgi:ADP-ribose pyrophosphatase YjhB (NUDIX family)
VDPTDRIYPSRPIVGVGGVVIEDGRALLIRRGAPPLQGEWSIPGGALKVGELLAEGVERELREETGLRVRVLGLLEVFDRIVRDDTGQPMYHFVILDYLCEKISGEARAGSDALEVAWAAEDELGAFNLTEAATRVFYSAFRVARRERRRSILRGGGRLFQR